MVLCYTCTTYIGTSKYGLITSPRAFDPIEDFGNLQHSLAPGSGEAKHIATGHAMQIYHCLGQLALIILRNGTERNGICRRIILRNGTEHC